MILVYMKATNRCNVGCTHCYLPVEVRADKTRMNEETLHSAAAFLSDMRRFRNGDDVRVLWHGGEPLVLSADWYWKAGELLDRELPGHSESMQTSLIPLRREHLALISERFEGMVGSSIDFSQRMLGGSVDAYHKLWQSKVDMARNAGIEVIPGIVPTTNELGREKWIVDWMVERGFPAFNVDRYNSYGISFPDRPTNRQHAHFLDGLFTALMERMERVGWAPMNGAIRASITGVLYGIGGDRWGGTCMNDFVVVEPDGSLNNCPDKSSFEEAYGNITEGYKAFAANKFRRKSIRHQMLGHKESHCFSCENQHFCASGCPITPNGPAHGEEECSGYRTYLSAVRRFSQQPGGRETMVAYLNQTTEGSALDKATRYGGEASQGACAA
jgi:radical SAM protein with 4Fe4S-binding SPASM domain